MLTRSLIATAAVLVVAVPPATADPDNVRTATRTLECDDGRTVEAVFAGEAGSNFNVTVDQSVFVYKLLVIDRAPLGPGGDDTVDERGVQGAGHDDLVTCEYMTGSGNHVVATGFFTPQRP
jgi:hypothetical protein